MSSEDKHMLGLMYRDKFLENEYLCEELTRRIRDGVHLAVQRDKYRRRAEELAQRLRDLGVDPDGSATTGV
jgi:hypothetical protein